MNSAFVFVKPHAVTEQTCELVRNGLVARGLKITSEGSISSEDIDKKQLIDQHYYAIASKATILKPHELNIPKDKFKAQFNKEWDECLAAGLCVNALDACKEFECDAEELSAAWAVSKKEGRLVKFGGGFYCGLVIMKNKELYVFNAFFMSMRSQFTKPGGSIHYFTVEWESAQLSWEDFRGKVLGPTDPKDAPTDSLRGIIMADWEKLGLTSEPNVGDNGVHASASPFEAAAERLNWLGASCDSDSYCKSLLEAGITAETIKAWSVDPQVKLDASGKMGSIFDAVEDLDATPCLDKMVKLQALQSGKAAPKNAAFVFVKPHAVTQKTCELVKDKLVSKGLTIISEGSISSEDIDKKQLIDQHYYAIASKATILKPHELNIPKDKFKAQFNKEWDECLAAGLCVNALDACKEFECDAEELSAAWAVSKKQGNLVKFGGGFYCGLVNMKDKALYVFNAFFMSMRSQFTKPGGMIHYFTVEWESAQLSWEDFRGKVLGPTDPKDAPEDSLRGIIMADWQKLGLAYEPNVGDNGVHASASPFEGAAERLNWLAASCDSDSFCKSLLEAGITAETIKAWSVDPQVKLDASGKMGSIFDALEDLDAQACLTKMKELATAQ